MRATAIISNPRRQASAEPQSTDGAPPQPQHRSTGALEQPSRPGEGVLQGSPQKPSPLPTKAILIPDSENDDSVICFDLVDDLWYRDAAEIVRDHGIPTRIPSFPSSRRAPLDHWRPFVLDTLGMDSTTLVIAHGTGAACLQRLLSDGACCAGAILVSPFDTDLHDEREMAAGYFSEPFDYVRMIQSCPWFVVVASEDDPFVPYESSERVAKQLDAAFYSLSGQSHFVARHHPALLLILREALVSHYGTPTGRPADCGRYLLPSPFVEETGVPPSLQLRGGCCFIAMPSCLVA